MVVCDQASTQTSTLSMHKIAVFHFNVSVTRMLALLMQLNHLTCTKSLQNEISSSELEILMNNNIYL